MKYCAIFIIIFVLFYILILNNTKSSNKEKQTMIKRHQIFEVEGCKYIIFFQKYEGRGISVVHAGNCSNELHKNK